MKVLFVTRRQDHKVLHPQIKIVQPEQVNLYRDLLKNNGDNQKTITGTNGWYVLGYDIENRSVEPCREGLLLSAFCNNPDEVIVIDNTSVNNQELFTPDILKKSIFISHNADHEACWGEATNFQPMRYFCTMVNDKRLLSGQEGYKFDLVSVINRRLGYKQIPIEMDKDIRSTFNDCTYFTNEQILYNAADTIRLKPVLAEQYRIAEERKQFFLLNTLNSRIIKPIAGAEVRGIRHNTEKWLNIARERQQKAELIWQELNSIVNSIPGIEIGKINPAAKKAQESLEKRQTKNQERIAKLQNQLKQLEEKGKHYLKSYQITKEQLEKLNLGLEISSGKTELGGLINWSSQKQVIEFLKQIRCPLPQAKDKKTYELKPGIGKEARANWFVENENSSFVPIMTLIDKQKKLIHNVNSFGEKWVEQYVRNGRVYTRFDQAGAATGRWTSGSKGKKKQFPNMSQIPKPAEYRHCFIADDGELIMTSDYKNQEGVIIIALSNDMEMKKITEVADQHSFLGTKAWRAVYANRYERTKDPKWLELSQTYEMNQSSDEKKKERDKFKNSAGLFPVLYGCNANKVAATAQVTQQEGSIMIDVIKSHAPKAQQFLDSKSHEASSQGYVIHNTRSGSRRYFSKVLDHLHYGFPLSKADKIDAEMQGRNTAIQGTGSDIIKEAIAMIDLWCSLYKQDIKFILSNYDEGVWSFPEAKKEQYEKVISHFMKKAANNYLIPGVEMDVEYHIEKSWTK